MWKTEMDWFVLSGPNSPVGRFLTVVEDHCVPNDACLFTMDDSGSDGLTAGFEGDYTIEVLTASASINGDPDFGSTVSHSLCVFL